MRVLKAALLVMSTTLLYTVGSSQAITVNNTTITPEQLVNNVLLGAGVTASNITYNNTAANALVVQESAGHFNANGGPFPLTEGVVLATGNAQVAVGPNTSGGMTLGGGNFGQDDPDLEIIEPAGINDAAILEFDFVPQGDTLRFRYIFASEEYEEYVFGGFNDAFGFFIAGPGISGPYSAPGGFPNGSINIALIPGTTTPVTIDNVNHIVNTAYYQNMNGATDIQFDGRTVILEAVVPVQCGQTYHIKLAIGDAGDTALDSGVFLEAGSFSSPNDVEVSVSTVTGDTTIAEGCDSATFTFIRPDDDLSSTLVIDIDVSGTATSGVDYNPIPDSIVFPIGEDSVEFSILPFLDADNTPESIIVTVYTVNQCGDTIANTGTIWIIDPPAYTVVTSDTTFNCPSATIPINVGVSGGTPTHTYTWTHGPTGSSITVPGNIAGPTTYTVDVIDACGVTSQGTVTVTYNPYTPSILFNQNTFNVCPGQSITITASEQSTSGAVSWDWDHGDVTASTTVSPTGNPGDEIWYFVEMTDDCHTIRDSVKAVIGQADIASISVTNATGCPPLFSNDNASVNVLTNPSTGMTVTLTQQGGAGTVHNSTGNYDFTNITGGYSYLVHVQDALGCTADSIIVVGIDNDPVTFDLVTDSIRNITCYGDGNGSAYIDNVQGGAGYPYTVEWVNGGVANPTTTLNSPDVDDDQDALGGGTWSVTVSDQAGCAWTEVFVINEPSPLLATLIPVEPSCYEMVNPDGSIEADVTGGNTPYSYSWTNGLGTTISNSDVANNLGEGWYHITITDNKGCQVIDSMYLDQPDSIAFTLSTTDVKCTYIDNGTLYITGVTVNEVDDYGFTLIPGGLAPNPIIQGDTLFFYNHLADGNYVLQVFDSINQCFIPNINVVINEAPAVSWVAVQTVVEDSDCQQLGGNGSVSAGAAGGWVDQFTYTWYSLPNDTVVGSTNPTWGNRPAGDYLVYAIEDSTDCRIDTILTVEQINPIADFTVDTTWAFAPHTIDLTNTSSNSSSWTWYVDGVEYATTSYSFAPDTLIDMPDTILICLYAYNNFGCVDSTCQTVVIVPAAQFIFPNVFTPNNDPHQANETFYLPLEGIKDFECTIFTRWGRKVTVLNPDNPEWDGTIEGKDASDGVYFYHYRLVTYDDTEYTGQGHVSLIRR